MNKLDETINDESIDERLKTYLKRRAVKYLPIHLIISLIGLMNVSIVFDIVSYRFMLTVVFFFCTVIGFLMARRDFQKITLITVLLTEIQIIFSFIVLFVLDERQNFSADKTTAKDMQVSKLCTEITSITVIFQTFYAVNFVHSIIMSF